MNANPNEWADDRAQVPVDPEWRPGRHLGDAMFADGSSAVAITDLALPKSPSTSAQDAGPDPTRR